MKDLIEAAKAARARAHAPYSKFYVGAAVRDEQGRVFGGCNIENAAYPQGWCAEPSAISHLIMAGGRRVTEVAVMGNGDTLCTPCGGCLLPSSSCAASRCSPQPGGASHPVRPAEPTRGGAAAIAEHDSGPIRAPPAPFA